MDVIIRSRLPITSSGCGSIRMTSSSVSLILELEYNERQGPQVGGLEFQGMIAMRFRNEMHSKGSPLKSYDTLVEVPDSKWRRQVVASGSPLMQEMSRDNSHH